MNKLIYIIIAVSIITAVIVSVVGVGNKNAVQQMEIAITEMETEPTVATYTVYDDNDDYINNLDTDNGGNVLKIMAWNDEFKCIFDEYYSDILPSDVEVEWLLYPTDGGSYQNKLEFSLSGEDMRDGQDNPIDVFMVEPDNAQLYINSDYTLNLNELGVSVQNCYPYTVDFGTNIYGELKAVTWQVNSGVFAYRQSIAEDVLGTADPDYIESIVCDWDTFDMTAAKMKSADYTMLSGYDDAYKVFANNVKAPWIDSMNCIHIDDNIMQWADRTMMYTENGYNNRTTLWGDAWMHDLSNDGRTFGCFFPKWGMDYVLTECYDCEPADDWAICEPPEPFYWGGTWLCISSESDNVALATALLNKITTDYNTAYKLAESGTIVNNISAMKEYANSENAEFINGQNRTLVYHNAAMKIEAKNMTAYDYILKEEFQEAFYDYFNSEIDKQTALEYFYLKVKETFPALTWND